MSADWPFGLCVDAFTMIASKMGRLDIVNLACTCKQLQSILCRPLTINNAIAVRLSAIKCDNSAHLLLEFGYYELYESIPIADDGIFINSIYAVYKRNEYNNIARAIKNNNLTETTYLLAYEFVDQINNKYIYLALEHSPKIFDYFMGGNNFPKKIPTNIIANIIISNNYAAIDLVNKYCETMTTFFDYSIDYMYTHMIEYMRPYHTDEYILIRAIETDNLCAYRYEDKNCVDSECFSDAICNSAVNIMKYILDKYDAEERYIMIKAAADLLITSHIDIKHVIIDVIGNDCKYWNCGNKIVIQRICEQSIPDTLDQIESIELTERLDRIIKLLL